MAFREFATQAPASRLSAAVAVTQSTLDVSALPPQPRFRRLPLFNWRDVALQACGLALRPADDGEFEEETEDECVAEVLTTNGEEEEHAPSDVKVSKKADAPEDDEYVRFGDAVNFDSVLACTPTNTDDFHGSAQPTPLPSPLINLPATPLSTPQGYCVDAGTPLCSPRLLPQVPPLIPPLQLPMAPLFEAPPARNSVAVPSFGESHISTRTNDDNKTRACHFDANEVKRGDVGGENDEWLTTETSRSFDALFGEEVGVGTQDVARGRECGDGHSFVDTNLVEALSANESRAEFQRWNAMANSGFRNSCRDGTFSDLLLENVLGPDRSGVEEVGCWPGPRLPHPRRFGVLVAAVKKPPPSPSIAGGAQLQHNRGPDIAKKTIDQREARETTESSLLRGSWETPRRHFLSSKNLGGCLAGAGWARVFLGAGGDVSNGSDKGASVIKPPGAADLSLRFASRPFVLYEYVEESPPILMHVGMSHRILAYFRNKMGRRDQYSGPPLGPFGTKPLPLVGSQPLPDVLGQQVFLTPGTAVAFVKSSVLRAPIVRRKPRSTDFLLLRYASRGEGVVGSKQAVGGRQRPRDSRRKGACAGETTKAFWIRRLDRVCVVGQTEPLVEVCAPLGRVAEKRRRACMRHFVREVRRRIASMPASRDDDDVDQGHCGLNPDEVRVLQDAEAWWSASDAAKLRDVIRSECRANDQAEQNKEAATKRESSKAVASPEDICVVEAMERGIQRLRDQKIDGFTSCSQALRKAADELEGLEARQRNLQEPLAGTARWIIEQLQLTPWHVTSDYTSVVNAGARKGAFFSITGCGDPSGGYGEGVSVLRIHADSIPEVLEAAALECRDDDYLIKEILRLDRSKGGEDALRRLGRRDRLARLRQLRKGAGSSSFSLFPDGEKPPMAELKRSYDKLLQEAYARHLAALSIESPPSPATEREESKANSVSHDEDDDGGLDLGGGLLDDLEAALDDCDDPELAQEEDVEDAESSAEMARLRAALGKQGAEHDVKPPKASVMSAGPSKVPMLKVVTIEKAPLGKQVERVLYVFGEDHIRLYREQQQRAADFAQEVVTRRGTKRGQAANADCDLSSVMSSGQDSMFSSTVTPSATGVSRGRRGGAGSDSPYEPRGRYTPCPEEVRVSTRRRTGGALRGG
eukprot:TRINITY_DN56444_c0_g1_i2.p1 TRINITY_DN56444_c0_g1~~TRINITY_DN56444_c0_g1_i2.p1  ORF type:complete len:1152 (+),score=189.21 TRINITY_DN56444_c0_g1_i2:30-3485(+)